MIDKNIFLAVVITLSIICVALIVGLTYIIVKTNKKRILKQAQKEAKKLKFQTIADGKAELSVAKNEFDEFVRNKKTELHDEELNLSDLKKELKSEINKYQTLIDKLERKEIDLESKNKKLDNEIDSVITLLEKTADLTKEEARKKIEDYTMLQLEESLNKELQTRERSFWEAQKDKAIGILIDAMQKYNVEIVKEQTLSYVTIESDDLKGKIIGKEGRNVKAFEQFGGVELVIDDTPNKIGVSSFNPIRREVAVKTLEELLRDGRIQPQKIEEELIVQQQRIDLTIKEVGEEIVKQLEIYNLDPEIVQLLGKLKYRTSYGQNVLQHSVEVAKISEQIAYELGLDGKIAKRAGLLHDIGKAVDFEEEGSHVTLGVQALKQFREDDIIINAVEAHHGDVPEQSFYASIIKIADTASASRPGARNNSSEVFFTKMRDLENMIKEFKGVNNAFALQSGRQIRVMIDPDQYDEVKLLELKNKITQNFKNNYPIPGDITITFIREKRDIFKI